MANWLDIVVAVEVAIVGVFLWRVVQGLRQEVSTLKGTINTYKEALQAERERSEAQSRRLEDYFLMSDRLSKDYERIISIKERTLTAQEEMHYMHLEKMHMVPLESFHLQEELSRADEQSRLLRGATTKKASALAESREREKKATGHKVENAELWMQKGQALQEQLSSTSDIKEHSKVVRKMLEAYHKAQELGEDVSEQLRVAYFNELQRGFDAFQAGRKNEATYGEAIQYFQNAITIAPDEPGAYVNMAYAMINAGRQEDAIEPFEQAIEMGETDVDSYVYLAELYRVAGRSEDAVELLQEAQQMYPDNADIDTQLLNAYQAAGMAKEALNQYRQEVERNPDNKLYRYNYGTLLLGADRFDEAIEQFEAAVEIDPQYVDAWSNLGAAYTNKAVAINESIRVLDDQRMETTDEAERERLEVQTDELVAERTEMFRQAVEPLDRAKELLDAQGEDTQRVCFALFQAYTQTMQTEKAEQVADCAGVSL